MNKPDMKIQRFAAALVAGAYNPDNPEKLVRNDQGAYVKYEDHKRIVKELQEYLDYRANVERQPWTR